MYIKGGSMDAVSYSLARQNLAKTMENVCESHEPTIITRNGHDSVVMISLDDYKSLEETSYLLRSPKNTRRLVESIAELNDAKGIEKELLD
jgi:antitoxin YefM